MRRTLSAEEHGMLHQQARHIFKARQRAGYDATSDANGLQWCKVQTAKLPSFSEAAV
jgi:hypothetical protein